MKAKAPVFFGIAASCESAFPDNDGDAETSSNKNGLIPVILCGAGGIHFANSRGLATVSAGKNIERDASRFEQLSQQDDEGSLSGSTSRDVSNAHDGALEALRLEKSTV